MNKLLLLLLLLLLLFMTNKAYANESKIALKLTCPQDKEMFLLHGHKLDMSISDLLLANNNLRIKIDELNSILLDEAKNTNIDNKNNVEKKIVEIRKGVVEQKNKAESNYNDQIVLIAKYTSKVKKCWGTYSEKDRIVIGEYLNKILKDKYLINFKNCITAILNTNKTYDFKYHASLDFFKGKATIQKVESIYKINDKNKKNFLSEENNKCQKYLQNNNLKFQSIIPKIPSV